MSKKTELPEFLYKYIDPRIEKIIKLIERNSLWAADPNSFNDPFDCFPYIDLSTTTAKSTEIYNKLCKLRNIKASRVDRRRYVKELPKEVEKEWTPKSKQLIRWRENIKQIGVVCLSEIFSDILMWSHYASNHEGVCIQYSTKEIPIEVFEKVEYLDERPTLNPYDLRLSMLRGDERDLLKEFFRKKDSNWSYEKEWRYFIEIKKENEEDINHEREIKLNENAIRGIYFGAKASAELIEKVSYFIKNKNKSISLYKCQLNSKKYLLDFAKL
ncbi:DUF2971 domain-containing protein [Gluconobacter sp. P5B12]|uniref:DUF2971 domain-containing protein n=1 Tax=Gluconobacter sp. P5B12 TaxID=2762618 RepID=UPI001C0404B8|nr:DUF2971 domain-containing protein [Gluconobacter sp. P5B12]